MNIVELAKLKKMVGGDGSGGGATVELDTTLTKHGKAAEAKATGDAINRLANETTISSDNTIKLTPVEKGKLISVAIAPDKNNALTAVEGGLFVSAAVPVAGEGIEIIDNVINVKLAETAHGLVAVNGALSIKLATKESAGAMSAEDKIILDSIPEMYVAHRYDISNVPAGTLVNYDDHEIRIMCPANADFNGQNTDTYYMTFKAYAPTEAVSFKHGDRGVIIDEMHTLNEIDELKRKYASCQFIIATYNANSNTWTYYGKNSTESKYIGWDYVVEWFDEKGIQIGFNAVRINLSNESCHYNNKPYYMVNYATAEEVAEIKEITSNVEEIYTWGEI